MVKTSVKLDFGCLAESKTLSTLYFINSSFI